MPLTKLATKQFVLWGAILCILIISACGEFSMQSTTPEELRYRDFSQARSAFIDGLIARDKDEVVKVTTEAAFGEISEWLSRPPVECNHKKGSYRMAGGGGSRISEIQTSDVAMNDKVIVQITCEQQDSKLLVLYNLEVEKLEFVYTDDGWKVDSWESIREHKGF